ncbi:MAG: hypothetical protein R6X02_13085 [Enhygromyxa sp.]
MTAAPVLMLCLVFAMPSCGEQADPWEDHTFEWHGEHVSVYGYGYAQADLCGGSLAELDGHTALIEDALGLAAPPYTFRWISKEEWSARTPCRLGVFCTQGDAAMARTLPQMHEATHALLYQAGVECPALLDEGLAMIFDGPMPRARALDLAEYEVEDLLRHFPYRGAAYDRAVHFVGFLIERYGVRKIIDLCRALPRRPTLTQWTEATSAVFEESLDELLTHYTGYPRCNRQQLRARLWGCAHEDMIFQGDLRIVGGCPDAQATNRGGGAVQILRRIAFPNEALVRVTVHAEGPSGNRPWYASVACAPCSESPLTVTQNDQASGPAANLHLYDAGLHEFVVYFDSRDNVDLHIWEEPNSW